MSLKPENQPLGGRETMSERSAPAADTVEAKIKAANDLVSKEKDRLVRLADLAKDKGAGLNEQECENRYALSAKFIREGGTRMVGEKRYEANGYIDEDAIKKILGVGDSTNAQDFVKAVMKKQAEYGMPEKEIDGIIGAYTFRHLQAEYGAELQGAKKLIAPELEVPPPAQEVSAVENNNPGRLREEAADSIKQQQWEKAGAVLTKVLELKPEDNRSRLELGKCQMELEKYEEAAGSFKKVLDSNPSEVELMMARYNLGHALLLSEKYQEAADVFKEHLKDDPYDSDAQYGLAESLELMGNFEAAAEVYEKYIALEKHDDERIRKATTIVQVLRDAIAEAKKTEEPPVEVAMAGAAKSAPPQEEAQKSQEQVEVAPHQEHAAVPEVKSNAPVAEVAAAAQIKEGTQLLKKKNYDGAIAAFKKAVALTPDDVNAWQKLANAYVKSGNDKEADTAFERANSIIQSEPNAHSEPVRDAIRLTTREKQEPDKGDFDVAVKLQQSSDFAGAVKEFRKIVNEEPRNAKAWFAMAETYQAAGDFAAAEKTYLDCGGKDMRLTQKEKAEALTRARALADVIKEKGSTPLVIKEERKTREYAIKSSGKLEKQLEANSTSVQAWIELGIAYMKEENYSGAVTAFEEAIKLKPGNPFALKNYAHALVKSGVSERAADIYRELIKKDARDKDVYDGLASIYEETGDFSSAINVYSEFLKLTKNEENRKFAEEKIAELERKIPQKIAQNNQ